MNSEGFGKGFSVINFPKKDGTGLDSGGTRRLNLRVWRSQVGDGLMRSLFCHRLHTLPLSFCPEPPRVPRYSALQNDDSVGLCDGSKLSSFGFFPLDLRKLLSCPPCPSGHRVCDCSSNHEG